MLRKLAALLIALMLLTGAQARSAYVVQAAGVAALVNGDGNILLENKDISVLAEIVPDALYAAGREGDLGLFDSDGKPLGDARYESIEYAGEAILFRQGGLYGAMDLSGETLIAPEWAQLTCTGEGAFLALRGDLYDDQPDEMFSVAPGETPVATGSLTANGLRAFHNGRMAFMQSDGQYGYVDDRGRQVIPPQWQYAGDFSGGVAVVSDGSRMGLIDTGGSIVLPLVFASIRRGQGLIATCTDDGRFYAYADGLSLCFAEEAEIDSFEVCGEYVILRQGGASRLYDGSGVCIYEGPGTTLYYPGLDGQWIAAEGAWGEVCQRVMNPDGSAASGAYQRILPLCGGRYAFLTFQTGDYESARYGLLSADGRELLPADYTEILPSGEDRLILVTGDAVTFADPDGNVLREWPVTGTAASSSEADA